MTAEEVFLGDIAADPSNAAVRLIYADWLQDQGWATARKLYPHLSPKGRVIAWTSDDHWNMRYRRSGLPPSYDRGRTATAGSGCVQSRE
jgi:uncharacterized protein (TIGR02996 family)